MAKNENYVFEKLSAGKVSGRLVKEEVGKVGVFILYKNKHCECTLCKTDRKWFLWVNKRSHLSFAHLYKGFQKNSKHFLEEDTSLL